MISLFRLFFPKVKTIKSALNSVKNDDSIQLLNKKYNESIHFEKDVTLIGDSAGRTIIEGILIIPKNVRVVFKRITISPTSQMYVEGDAIFEQCTIEGNIDILLTINGGYIIGRNCTFKGAKEVAVALINNSSGLFEHCTFQHNGKMHLLVKNSKAFIENSDCSNASQGFWITGNSFMQSKNCFLQYHKEHQILIENSTYIDHKSTIQRGEGYGIFADHQSDVTLNSTNLLFHKFSQLFIQNSYLNGKHCTIQNGNECGVALQNAESIMTHCEISHHNRSNIHVSKKSKLHLERCEIHSGHEYGLLISKESIVNCKESNIENHSSIQVVVTEKSLCSMKECIIVNGHHVGFIVDKKSECMLAHCKVNQNGNSAINVDRGMLKLFQSEVCENNGNGVLATTHSKVEVDGCKFTHNHMPHIASKTKVKIQLTDSTFENGKSIFVLHRCEIHAIHCRFHDSMNVQIEINEHSTAKFEHCQIYNGKSYGVKVIKNSNFFFYHSQIFQHDLAQIVVNDSSVILKESEIYQGKRNALFIQNHSEVYIQ
ncbi:MAG: hypothetical protein GX072_03930, partial [Lysinibacillus sp.]|nr:hypothetical protein [Lysinibacillus sp.]